MLLVTVPSVTTFAATNTNELQNAAEILSAGSASEFDYDNTAEFDFRSNSYLSDSPFIESLSTATTPTPPPAIPVTQIILPGNFIFNRSSTQTLNPVFSPSNFTVSETTIRWSSSDTAVATVNAAGEVRAIDRGTARITVTAVTSGGREVSASTNIRVRVPVTAVTLPNSRTFETGQRHQLSPTFTPSNFNETETTITWRSSNPRIATVNDRGQVNPLRRGTTTISVTVQTTSGARVSASTRVTVRVRATGVRTLQSLRMVRGRTVSLPATVQPFDSHNRQRRFSSSNTRVVSINNTTGRMTARAVGSARITVRSVDGSHTARFTVHVVPRAVRLQTFRIPNPRVDRGVRIGGTIRIRVNPIPANATHFMPRFTSSNPSIARVDRTGTVTGLRDGTVRITARQGNISRSVRVHVGATRPFYYVQNVNLRFRGTLTRRSSTTGIVLHHTVGNINIRQTHDIHLRRGMRGVAYHFLIDRQGVVWQGRPLNMAGGHVRGNLNNTTIGVAWVGNFENEQLTPAARAAGEKLIRDILRTHPDVRWIHGHRDLRTRIDSSQSATACPGRNFPTQHFRNLLR